MQNNKTIFVYFILFILIKVNFSYAQENKPVIIVKFFFSDKIKFNNKLLLKDMSSDLSKYIKSYDSTDDMLESGNFIYYKDQIERIVKIESDFNNILIEEFKKNAVKTKFNFDISPYTNKTGNEAYILDINILEYQEGEYNLIKNTPTFIKLSCNFMKNDLENKHIFKLIKIYKKNSSINCPVESIRFKQVSNELSLVLLNKIKLSNIAVIKQNDIIDKDRKQNKIPVNIKKNKQKQE